jgi:hypothetical protein
MAACGNDQSIGNIGQELVNLFPLHSYELEVQLNEYACASVNAIGTDLE